MKDEDEKISRKRVFTFVNKSKQVLNVQITSDENEKISRKSVCSFVYKAILVWSIYEDKYKEQEDRQR